ncbi:hypothetical protein [uncultured Sphingomonas sp.]|uniref:hypothetical protein n=1 Tax=uncultured Sphingomonas sp. TaxID=158754 RepID=UPI0035CB452F
MIGRPLRFLGATLAAWTAARVLMLWPALDAPSAVRGALVPAAAARTSEAGPFSASPVTGNMVLGSPRVAGGALGARSIVRDPMVGRRRPPAADAMDDPNPASVTGNSVPSGDGVPMAGAMVTAPRAATASRWSVSGWLVARDGRGLGAGINGGQLGGAQGGIRVAYAIDRARRLQAVARVTTPLAGRGREGSVGLEWRPTSLPVRLVAEQRWSLDGGRGGPAIGIVGGTGPARTASGIDLETYGQAGVIRRDRTEAFIDGAARATRPLTRLGRATIDLGIGTWGGAQRDAARLDAGPTLGMRVPVADRTIRVTLDWRQRVAGRARPGSGPALTVGGDF